MLVGAAVLDEKVLVLNKLYAAVRVVSARRAFVMLCKGIAEVLAVEDGRYCTYDIGSWADLAQVLKQLEPERHEWIRTPRLEIPIPRIIRLHTYDRVPRPEVKLTRRNIYARDHNRCQYCGKVFATKDLTIDHVLPRVQGGANTWENLVCACLRCNTRKGGRTPLQAQMRLIRAPVRPKRCPVVMLRLGSAKYESWKAFLDGAYWTVELKE